MKNKTNSWVAVLTSNKIYFKVKVIRRYNEDNFIILKDQYNKKI